MSYGARALVTVMVVVLVGMPAASTAQEPVMEVAARGPRFLLASAEMPPTLPKVVRPETVPVLRRRIAVALDGVPLEQALTTISREGRLPLVYSRSVLDLDAPVRLRAADISVAAALTVVLLDAGIDVLVRPDGQLVLVRRSGRLGRYAGMITGRVTDTATGQPVRGADISLKGTSFKTVTGDSGLYRLPFEGIASGQYTMQLRMLGYRPASRVIEIVDTNATIRVDIVLQPAAVALDELVTTATGQQRRRDLGNAITTIRADSVMQSAPIRNLTDLLENRVPGLTVQRTTGAPGDPSRLRLRGLGSVSRGNDPVVIVDGVRVYAAQSETRSANLTNLGDPNAGVVGAIRTTNNSPAPSPLDQIDPNIIEKIEVFKGPSAATLYGADAANGVIVITTKRGRPGPTQWTANISHGRTTTPGRWPDGYFRMGHSTGGQGDGMLLFCPITYVPCVQDSVVKFQALNEPNLTILGDGGRRTALTLGASGGTQALTYSVIGSYSDETGLLQLPTFEAERFRLRFNREAPDWMQQPHHYKAWSVTTNVTTRLSSTADVMLSTSLTRSEQQRSTLEKELVRLAGTYVDTTNGLYYPLALSSGTSLDAITSTYLASYYTRTTASTITFTSNFNTNWRPRPWFTATGSAGLNIIPRQDELFLPAGLVAANDSGALIRGIGRSLVSTFNLQGQLRKPLGWGFNFETSVGANITTDRTDDLITSAAGLVPGTSSIQSARRIVATDAGTNTSVFGWYVEPRITGQRLSLSTGIRLDGGSNYGTRLTGRAGSGLGSLLSLPKLNGSWVISEEPWFPFPSLVSSLRLRGAYGQAQVQPGPADRLRLYSGRVEDLLWLDKVGNTKLRPERSVEFEGGVDADLFDSRVTLELTAYRKTQIDALMPVRLPTSVNGGGSVIQNIGNIRNSGLELTLGVTPIQLPLVTWSAQFSYSRNTNTLVKLGSGVLPNKAQGLVEGYPVRGRWARPILGFVDSDGDGLLRVSEVRVGDSLVFMGRLLPDNITSLSTNLVLFGGAVGATADFSYQAGATQVDQTVRTAWVLVRGLSDPSAPLSDQAAAVASTGPTSDPRYTDYGLTQDISTFRFNTFSVNYRAPARVARLLRAQNLTVGIQGSNLGLHTTYRGKDPNVNSLSVGEGIVDTGQLPQPRTWLLSLSMNY